MLLRWIDQKLIFSTTCLDGTNVVLIHSCVLMRGESAPADALFGL